MQYLKNLYHRIVYLGIDESYTHFKKLRLKIINQFTIIIAIGTFIGGVIAIYNREPDFYNAFFMMFTSLLVLYLAYHKKHNTTRFYCTYIYPIFILYMIILYGSELKLEFGYGAFILSSVFIYEKNRSRFINISFIIILQIIGFYYCRYYESIYASSVNFIDTLIVVCISMFCCFLLLKTYFDESRVYYKKQFGFINILEEKNNKLNLLINQNKTKNELLSILAHDLKGPAASFKNLTKKLQYLIKEKDQDRIIEMSNHYESQGKVLFYNLDNLLNWVLSQKEEIKPIFEEIKIHTFFDEITEWQSSFYKTRKINYLNKIDQKCLLYSDRNILKIIFSNIINNAIKFSKDDGVVIIESSNCDKEFTVTIRDDGVGIPPEKVENIINNDLHFTDNIRSNGHGLGLQTCFFLVNKLKGSINIESKLNHGTVVSITLPIISRSESNRVSQLAVVEGIF